MFKFIYILKCFAGFKPQGNLMWPRNKSIQTIGLVDIFYTDSFRELLQNSL